MNSSLRTFLGLSLLVAPLATGCASRVAPFDSMDQAQITVMRLQQPPPPPAVTAPAAGGSLIPGLPIPPELQAAGQQVLQGLGQAVPGLIPPGLIPGQPAAQQPVQQQMPQFGATGLGIVASMPVSDDKMKETILDALGLEDSFVQGTSQCPTAPGLGISMVRPGQQNVDVLISMTCNKAYGVNGFQWPHKMDTFNSDTAQKMHGVYQQLFGMPAPQGS